MLILGLTGGIASGKSTASKYIATKHKIPIIDADAIAREIVEPGKPAYNAIVRHFESPEHPTSILLPDGQLNRKELGRRVFDNKKELAYLNSVTHPAVRKLIMCRVLKYYFMGYRMCILDVPLLFESNLDLFCGLTISIICNSDLQFRRLMERNNELTTEDAKNRINSQMSTDKKIERSDYVIENNTDITEFYQKIDMAIDKVRPTIWRTLFELIPFFGFVSGLCIVLRKYWENRSYTNEEATTKKS